MNHTFIAAAVVAALSFPAFGAGWEQAEHAKLVTSVQAQLGVVPADGKMGPRTAAALKEFQRAKHLQPTGKLDNPTLAALGHTGPKPSSAAGESTHMAGKPSTPIGPQQPSEERAAEPKIKPEKPTGG
jgi:peptidoglycan hydrolase-like protein with peptidoglycan-binding domain